MATHELTLNVSDTIWNEVERYKTSMHTARVEDACLDLLQSALLPTIPVYLKKYFAYDDDCYFVYHLKPFTPLTEEQFFQLCQENRDLRLERSKEGEIIIMPPTGGETGRRNTKLTARFETWAEHDLSGLVFDSSTGFHLPNGADRSPDVAWVRRERLVQLTPKQKQHFLPLCPDFVLELRSPSDSLLHLQQKMQEYLENGAQLGWLLDARTHKVYVYRPEQRVECLENPATLSGDPVLTGFILNLQEIWETDF